MRRSWTDSNCGNNEGVQQSFANWTSTGIQGGFLWLYDSIVSSQSSSACGGPATLQAYVQAIDDGLRIAGAANDVFSSQLSAIPLLHQSTTDD